MPTETEPSEIAFELHFATYLPSGDVIDSLQTALAQVSPRFAASLKVLEYERDRNGVAVDLSRSYALRDAVEAKGSMRGRLFRRLTAKNPASGDGRGFGSVLLRGNVGSAFLTLSFDEHVPVRRAGDKWLFSNSISARVAGDLAGAKANEWARAMLEALAQHPTVLWGAAYAVAEFHRRNLEGGTALGRDVRKYLPGLFWVNVFGATYRQLIGDDRFPLELSRQVGPSIVLTLYPRPDDWDTTTAAELHRTVLNALGSQYFFDRLKPHALTIAPDFQLPGDDPTSRPS